MALLSNVRHALRSLRRAPAFTMAAVATLALGIGANTAIFSVVNGVLLDPLGYPDPEYLVVVWGRHATIGQETASLPDFLDWRSEARSFESLAAMTHTRFNLTGAGEPEVVRGALATAGLLRVFGIVPSVGRGFSADEERVAAPRVAMLDEGYWQRRYGGQRDIIGRQILLSGIAHTVVGVVPAALRLEQPVEIWTPLATDTTRPRRADFLTVFGRLKAGVTRESAQQEMTTIARRLEAQYPQTNAHWGAEVVSLREQVVGEIRPALLAFMGAVGLVLLIACTNVANLMLARVAGRSREMTIRSALGASRARIAGELLLESVLLGLLGGCLGLLLAVWGIDALRSLEPGTIPRIEEIGLDLRVLGFALALSLVTGLLFGLAPAWRLAGRDLRDGLTEGSRGVAGGRGIHRTRSALIFAEVALAFVLLAGAVLLLRSFDRLQRVDPGFTSDRVLTARVTLPRIKYPDEAGWTEFGGQLLARTEAQPGVASAALVSDAPLGDSPPYWSFEIQGVASPRDGSVQDAAVFTTSAGYFETLRIPLIEGRFYQATDRAGTPDVAVISQSLARRFWKTGRALGARITLGDPADPEARWLTVVGVAGDTRQERLSEQAYPQIYLPFQQSPTRSMVLTVRVVGDPSAIVPAIRRSLAELDPELPLADVGTLEARKAASLARPRINATVFGTFALAALVLAAVGIYGVVAYGVVQRTRELGIRMALGAGGATLLRMVIRQGMAPVLGGLVLGLAGALAGGHVLRGLLFGVGTSDPATFAAVTFFLVAVALAATYLPARRAARSDPMIALRND
ncbi:MAG: ABC transporter permease [Gemmatimonadales bacterium]|nr:ABC transporter permease [Gemmatimonadales bacterium]